MVARAGMTGPRAKKVYRFTAMVRLARLREKLDRIEHPTADNAHVYVEDCYQANVGLLKTDIARLINRTTRI